MTHTRLQTQSDAYLSQGVTRLFLSSFRSYESLNLTLDTMPVILTGDNGAGKTNILEALSFLAPGRGLRKARLSDVQRIDGARGWAVSARMYDGVMHSQVGTGLDPVSTGRDRRIAQVNGEKLKTLSTLSEYTSVCWLTPQMDRLFLDGSTQRRSFLDRLVAALDPHHADRLHQYEHIMRERSTLLKEGGGDPLWLNQLEERMAGLAVALEWARHDVIQRLNVNLTEHRSVFPHAVLSLKSHVIEPEKPHVSSLECEQLIREKLEACRVQDSHVGGAGVGAHKSDLHVLHGGKNMPADICSTGEQKAVLLSIIIAFSRVQSAYSNGVPLLLLDEVIAHLDQERRLALFEEIKGLRVQAWLTGTDASVFDGLKNDAQVFHVKHNALHRGN